MTRGKKLLIYLIVTQKIRSEALYKSKQNDTKGKY